MADWRSPTEIGLDVFGTNLRPLIAKHLADNSGAGWNLVDARQARYRADLPERERKRYPDEIGGKDLIEIWNDLKILHQKYPTRFLFNEPELSGVEGAPLLYQIADFFLRPAIYEPCGSSQMQCQRYGCIPIVRKTGGLADTVRDASMNAEGNGFTFNTLTPIGLLGAVRRAVDLFKDVPALEIVITKALQQQNDWSARVQSYERVYEL